MSASPVGHGSVWAQGHTFCVGGGDWHKRKRRSFAGFARSVFALLRKRNAILGLWKVLLPGFESSTGRGLNSEKMSLENRL